MRVFMTSTVALVSLILSVGKLVPLIGVKVLIVKIEARF